MTSPQEPVTPAAPPPTVTPEPESRFEQLVTLHATLKPQLDALQERVEALSKGIKNEAIKAAPEGTTEVILRHPALPHPYHIHPREEMRFSSKDLKEKDPETYVRYCSPRTTWRMDPIK